MAEIMENSPHDVCKNLYKMFELIQRARHTNLRTIFDDFCLLSMASYHNIMYSVGGVPVPSFYKANHDLLEKEYKDTIEKYKEKDAYKLFPEILGALALAMKERPYDYLGKLYMDMNINSKTHGQFFTPPHICEMMAAMTVGSKEAFESICKKKGYFGASDPACGSGAMVIGLVKVLEKDYGIENLDIKLYAELTDIDYTCVKMAYVNMAVLGLSARIVWGNTLTMEHQSKFDTPCLQVALAQGRFQTREQKVPEEPVKEKIPEIKCGQLTLF